MKILNRLVPHPYLTLMLTVTWLMLVNGFSINSLVFGLFLGLLIPFVTQPFWPNRPKLSKPLNLIGYAVLVIWDIIVANFVVARIVLFMPNSRRQPAFVTVPLDIRTPEAIAMLGGTITMTPGTVTCDISGEGHALLVHCLHAPDPEDEVATIKSRYEARLKEIFE